MASGARSTPTRFRTSWTGVMMSPHGIPHQPQSNEKKKSPNCCLMPQERHEIRGVLVQWVIRSIDQIWCEVWTSIGPLPPQWEHRPPCTSWAARTSASCGTPSAAIATASWARQSSLQ